MTQFKSNTLSILVLLSLCLLISAREVNLRNLKMYDKQGRQLYLHGVNVVVKVPPYMPTTGEYDPEWSFGPSDIKILKDNGFNSIRLGLMWAGVQPKKDWYNQTYLDQMVKIVNAAGQAGIYTMIDFHQDLLSQKFCGDGVPVWLIDEIHGYKTFPFPMGKKIKLNETGLPGWDKCDQDNWGKYYFSYDVGQAFNHLYNTNHHLNKKFNDYWTKIAETFKGNPYIIAYELINEPFIGNFWRDPVLVIPSMAERMKLQNFYDKLSETIRSVDKVTPLCFEPVTFDNFVPTGFSHPPGGNKYRNQSMFCYHHYEPPALSLKSLDTYVQDAKKLKVVSILSETWGTPETLERAEYWKQSWMYWNYKSFGKNWGMPAKQGVKSPKPLDYILQADNDIDTHLLRSYFPHVAGELEETKFNMTTGHFAATYHAIPGGESVLFISKPRTYGNGYMISSYPQAETEVKEDNGNYVSIKYTGKQVNKKILVTVTKL